MCSPITCRTCGNYTWTGCGAHVDQVRAKVPAAMWCAGHQGASTATVAHPGSNLVQTGPR